MSTAVMQTSDAPTGRNLRILSLAALGVVYGDIGTSPLYAIRECFFGPHAIAASAENVLGVLSLIFWALILVISVKYLVFIMRADNRGEGGILALMALLRPVKKAGGRWHWLLIVLGLFGAALLYGDGMITPAISVLSAVEGLEVATSFFSPFVVPITIGILVVLFLFQRFGTARVGAVFGPVMLVWFATLAWLGVAAIVRAPGVLAAISPTWAVSFFTRNGGAAFLVLGAVVLVVTGGEALYADMGHFGKRPIRIAWFALVLPALVLNYFGQGALLIEDRGSASAIYNPFYQLVPSWGLYPLVVLATAATVIASQAIISGAFSLTRQAVQLGYCPRVEIVHTSAVEIGQIYVPAVNWALMLSTIGLVVGFGASSRLAAAYGVAVTTTMVITTILAYFVERKLWGWRFATAFSLTAGFIVIDLAFFSANMVKVEHGGWFPLAVAAVIYVLMSTWNRGREMLNARLRESALPIATFLEDVAKSSTTRVAGNAIFLTRTPDVVPSALLHNIKHNKVLHQQIILLTLSSEEVPHVLDAERCQIQTLGNGFYQVVARYGFMEDPDVPKLLEQVRTRLPELKLDPAWATYFLGRETLLPGKRPGMSMWAKKLFSAMSRNAFRATGYFRLPPNRVIELGMQVEL